MAEISADATNITDKLVKRLNERYTQIARDFGATSAIAKNYQKKLEAVFGTDNMHRAKARKSSGTKRRASAADMGLMLVDRNADTRNVSQQDLDALLSLHTAGDIKRVAKEQAKRESEYSQAMGGGPVTVDDVLAAMDYVYKLDDKDDNDLYEAYKMYWESVGGAHTGVHRPDYTIISDLAKAIKEQNDAVKAKNTKEVERIDNYINNRLNSYNTFNAGSDYFGGL